MFESPSTQDPRLLEYVQSDAPAREELFPGFISALKTLARSGHPEVAAVWARRAVSVLLDYSSLMALRRFLVRPGPMVAGKPLRLAILGGSTTHQLRELIEVFLAGEEIAAEVYESDYGVFRHEVLTPGSALDAFRPDVVFIATDARNLAHLPRLDASAAEVADLVEREVAGWALLWKTIHERWNATVIQNNVALGPGPLLGHYALRHPGSRENYLGRINRAIVEQAPAYTVLHDIDRLAAEAGAHAWFDARFYFEFKMPCGAECLVTYAHSVVSLLRAATGRRKKVLVLDLDNTLWGGVIGDLGPGGIRYGEGTGEGEAYIAFQRYAQELRQLGIVLAVCSKNDDDKAREAFERREDMILRLSDFAVFLANWTPKPDNLCAIARRLDLGLDSFVFADDNPAERALVRRSLPEVAVPDLPEDPAGYVAAVARHRYFETTGLTNEDASRALYYENNARRKELAAQATDLSSFLASLEMKMVVRPVDELNVERVTQLVNKSNQFNLTTRRYTREQVVEMAQSPNWSTLTFSLRDKLGDSGLIGVIFLNAHGETLEIDTWLMSCRVLQRSVEQFMCNEVVDVARRRGAARIAATYIPTAKNGMVRDLYGRLGFTEDSSIDGRTHWSLALTSGLEPSPTFIIKETSHAR